METVNDVVNHPKHYTLIQMRNGEVKKSDEMFRKELQRRSEEK